MQSRTSPIPSLVRASAAIHRYGRIGCTPGARHESLCETPCAFTSRPDERGRCRLPAGRPWTRRCASREISDEGRLASPGVRVKACVTALEQCEPWSNTCLPACSPPGVLCCACLPATAACLAARLDYLRTSAPWPWCGSDRGERQRRLPLLPILSPWHRRGAFTPHAQYSGPSLGGSTLHVTSIHLPCFRLHPRSFCLPQSTSPSRRWPVALLLFNLSHFKVATLFVHALHHCLPPPLERQERPQDDR